MNSNNDQGGIVRVVKDAKYFSASNEVFNDNRISWETRGLMGYLLSKPNNWTIRKADLLQQGSAKDFKLRRMLAEARMYGYMSRIRVTRKDGTFDWITNVYESPSLNPAPSKDFQKLTSARFSTSGLPTSGKPRDVLNTDSVITDSDEDERKRLGAEIETRTQALKDLYEHNVGPITPLMMNFLRNAAIDYPNQEWYQPAFEAMVKGARHRSWNFVDSVLQGWKEHYFGWKPDFAKNGKGVKHAKSKDNSGGQPGLSPEGQAAADEINKRRAAKNAALPSVR